MTYEDCHKYDGGQVYIVPNEEVLHWRELLKKIPVYRAAAICSGGEVGFFSLLPLVRDELVLVDHSYRSLAVAMSKYLILQDRGWKASYELFTSGDKDKIEAAFNGVLGRLPDKAIDAWEDSIRGGHIELGSATRYLKDEWEKTPVTLIQKACRKLHKVRFVHGDLMDLKSRGPFGLLYLSNALEHRDRSGRSPLIPKVERLVRPGGYVVAAHSTRSDGIARWEQLGTKSDRGFNHSTYISWKHTLYRIPKVERAPEALAVVG